MLKNSYMNIELFKNSPIVFFICKNERKLPIEYVSKNIKNIFGYKAEEFLENKIKYEDIIHKDDLQRVLSEISQYLKKKNYSFTHKPYRIIDKQNRIKWISDTTTVEKEDEKTFFYLSYITDITKEINLRKKNERYKLALQATNDGLWDWNVINNDVYFSSTCKEILGFEKNSLENNLNAWKKLIHTEDREKTLETLYDFVNGKTKSYSSEYRLKCKKNSYKWVLGKANIIEYTKNNKPKRIIGTCSDISEKKAFEQKLIQNENIFTKMFQEHDSIMFLINPKNKKIIDINNKALKFYGYSKQEMKKLTIYDINTESKQELDKKIESVLAKNLQYFETIDILKDGSKKEIEVHASSININNSPLLFVVVHDITLRNRLQNDIKREKNFISAIFENANTIITVIDEKGTMIKINKYGLDFVGYSQKEICSKPFFWKVFLEKNEEIENISILFKNKKIFENPKTTWISKKGEKRVFEWSNTIIKCQESNYEMKYLVSIGIDITKQEKQKKELEIKNEELETIFTNAKDGIAVVDTKGNFLNFNEEFMNILGYSKEELLKKSAFDITLSSEHNDINDSIEKIKKHHFKKNYERVYLTKSKKLVILNMSASLLPDLKRILITTKDITKDKLFEQQSKLASMGEMIGNIAHQWRQPLSTISAISLNIKLFEQIGKDLPSEELIEQMDSINQQVQYLSKTIDDFRNFIKENNQKELINISNILEKTLLILKPSISNHNITIIENIKDDLKINAYKNELIQSFINIINNSKDAINQNNQFSQNDKLIFISTKKVGDNLVLEIKDNGGGINDEIKNRIFEPYFTTKHQSIGTGIGLSMTYKILVKHHDCKITVNNKEFKHKGTIYKGLSFKITFKKA